MMELHVRIVSARNLIDKQTFGKQDPYCKVRVGHNKFKTRVHDNGDRTPVWNEKFVFQVYDPQMEQIYIQVNDKNFTASILIGEVRLPVNMFLHGNVTDQWYTLNNGSRRAGDINLRVQLLGANGAAMAAPGYAVAAPVYNYAHAPPPQPHYAPPPPMQYAPPPPMQYAPPPPPVYYAPAPPVVVAPPPVMYAPAPAYGPGYYPPHHHHGHHGYHGRGRHGMDGGDLALGIGAGVVGGLLLGETLDIMF